MYNVFKWKNLLNYDYEGSFFTTKEKYNINKEYIEKIKTNIREMPKVLKKEAFVFPHLNDDEMGKYYLDKKNVLTIDIAFCRLVRSLSGNNWVIFCLKHNSVLMQIWVFKSVFLRLNEAMLLFHHFLNYVNLCSLSFPPVPIIIFHWKV